MSNRMPDSIPERMPEFWQKKCQIECQRKCQQKKNARIECQKIISYIIYIYIYSDDMSEIRTDKFQGSKDDEFLAPFQWIALISLMKITSLGNK